MNDLASATFVSRWQAYLTEGERKRFIEPATNTGTSLIDALSATLTPASGDVDLQGLLDEMRQNRL